MVEIIEMVAVGAMGEVWRGHHHGLDVPVAVKLLTRERLSDPEVRERFEREARAAAKIESEHVVRTYDCGRASDGRPYIVMEWLTGVTLQRLLDEHGLLEPSQVAIIIEQLCRALDAVHTAGVVHRDVKPDNVLIVPGGTQLVKLVDFSVSSYESGGDGARKLTNPGTLVGTPLYMSREYVVNGEADWRSDLWSVGVVGYELLTGALPFTGDTIGAVCIAVAEGRCRPPSAIVPTLGPAIDDWFARATAPEPEDRFGSAAEMASALNAAVQSASGQRRRTSSGSRTPVSARCKTVPAADLDTSLHPVVGERRTVTRRRPWGLVAALSLTAALGAGWYFEGTGPLAPLLPRQAAYGLSREAEVVATRSVAALRFDEPRWMDHALWYENAYESCREELAGDAAHVKPAHEEPRPEGRPEGRVVRWPARPAPATLLRSSPRAASHEPPGVRVEESAAALEGPAPGDVYE
jgi:serine/threonine-protein kinase